MFWEIFEALGSIVMGWILGRMIIDYINKRSTYVDTEDQYLIKLKSAKIFYIEQINNQLMLYDALNDRFVCQADDLDSLAANCFQLAKVNLAVVKWDYNYLCFNKGQVLTDFSGL